MFFLLKVTNFNEKHKKNQIIALLFNLLIIFLRKVEVNQQKLLNSHIFLLLLLIDML